MKIKNLIIYLAACVLAYLGVGLQIFLVQLALAFLRPINHPFAFQILPALAFELVCWPIDLFFHFGLSYYNLVAGGM